MITDNNFTDAYVTNFDAIISRFMDFFGLDELQKVAQMIGLTKQAFYARKKTNSVPYEQIVDAVKDSGVNFEWLFYGIGEKKIIPRLKLGDEKDEIGKIAVRFFDDVAASAGLGCLNGDHCESELIYIDRFLFPKSTSKHIEAIRVHGDSMEPTIHEEDMIFVDKSQCEIRNGKIFVVRMNDELFVKRIFFAPKDIIVKSDNPTYPQFNIKKDEIEILGQVIYAMEYHG